jgi:hypothetical protein
MYYDHAELVIYHVRTMKNACSPQLPLKQVIVESQPSVKWALIVNHRAKSDRSSVCKVPSTYYVAETEFTRCLHSYDADSLLFNEPSSLSSSVPVSSTDKDLQRLKCTRDGGTSLLSSAASASRSDVAVTSRTPSSQPEWSATSADAFSSASRFGKLC